MAKGRRSSSAAKTETSPKETIKNFFKGPEKASKEAPEEVAKAVEGANSPGKTSDYESEANSRSTTPAPTNSPKEAGDTMEETEKPKMKNGHTDELAKGKRKSEGVLKREVKAENDDDMDEGADVFSSQATNDDDDDSMDAEEKDTVKAALKTGMLGKGVAEEEERMAAENKRSVLVFLIIVDPFT